MTTTRRSAVLVTGNVLCNNPRVIKEADALAGAGWDVEVLGAWLADEFVARDEALLADRPWRFTPVVRPETALWPRVRTRLARELGARVGVVNSRQLGYAGSELLRAASRRHADLFVAHSEQALWVTSRLADRGRRVGVDMEDWFSEDLAVADRTHRPTRLLRSLESQLLLHGRPCTAPSEAMSRALAETFGCPVPVTIYNAFPWEERSRLDGRRLDRTDTPRPSIHWYSQTIGPGRGLEQLCLALAHVPHDAEVHLRGTVTTEFRDHLVAMAPAEWRSRVYFHPPVPNEQLLSRIAEHDIGFAGETSAIRSRDLTITNKILHYLLGGLAVVASNTAGQREVAAEAGEAVRLVDGSVDDIAAALNMFLTQPDTLLRARRRALEIAERTYCWERQVPKLLTAFESAVAPGGTPAARG